MTNGRHRYGFTGTRHGMTQAQLNAFREYLKGGGGWFHHGDCVGADAQAQAIAGELGYSRVVHPPSDASYRAWCTTPSCDVREPKPYLVRNRDIVDDTILLIAAPLEYEEQPRGGTWSTIRYARSIGRTVALILPNGTIRQTGPGR